MKFKTLSGKEYELNIDMDNETVESVIGRLESECSVLASKLVVNGKILNPAETFKGANVEAQNFVVVVPQKKAVARPKPVVEPVAAPPQQIQSTPQPEAPVQTATPSTPTTPVQQTAPETLSQVTQPAPSTDSESSSTVQQSSTSSSTIPGVPAEELELFENNLRSLTDMGFEREQAVRCLRASFNDINTASEFLLSGYIPEQLLPLADGILPMPTRAEMTRIQQRLQRQQAPQSQAQQGGNPLASLLGQSSGESAPSNPIVEQIQGLGIDFDTIRQALQQNPSLLEPILQTIQQQNPEVFEIIQRDPQAFIQLLNQPAPPQQRQTESSSRPGSGVQTIQITPEEGEAIGRLVDLGFDRNLAAHAYFSFGRDENAAANFLFDQGGDFQAYLGDEGNDDNDDNEDNDDNDDMDDMDDA